MENHKILQLKFDLQSKTSLSLVMFNKTYVEKISLKSSTQDLTSDSYAFKNGKLSETTINLVSLNSNNGLSNISLQSRNSVRLTIAREQGIVNNIMIKDFNSYLNFSTAMFAFMKMYSKNSKRNNNHFPLTDNTCNQLLKYHQRTIMSLDAFRKAIPNTVINNEIYEEIKFFL